MSRRYVVKLASGEWDAEVGDTIELDLDPPTEDTMVGAGRLEIAPRTYRVTGEAEVHETRPGDTFEGALPAGQEAALIAGRHIELADEGPGPEGETKEELLARARDLEIEGRSAMSKDELLAAIAETTSKEKEGG